MSDAQNRPHLRPFVICAAVLGIAPAVAQTAEPAEADTATGSEIVVTAQRRSERLQEVPVSITAVSAAQLEKSGIKSTQDLAVVTPGLVFARSSSLAQPTIRGIGTRNGSPGDESNVAIYLDGVYQHEPQSLIFDLDNIDHVEVLKGPQGTLFGRNATGGAIRIITKMPSFSWTGNVTGTVGTLGYRKGSAYLSGPLAGDTLAASVNVISLGDNGFVDNVFLGGKQAKRFNTSVRGRLLLKPADGVEFILSALSARGSDNTTYSHHPINGNAQARRSPNPANIPLDILIPSGSYTTATNFVPYLRTRYKSVDLQGHADLGFATLGMVASYSKPTTHIHSDLDSTPLNLSESFENRAHQYGANQELTLASRESDRLNWIIGANAFQARAQNSPIISNGVATIQGQTTRAAAGFGEVTWEAIDRVFFTGGLRYSWDRKHGYNVAQPSNVKAEGRHSWTDLSPRVVVRWAPSSDASLYASYSEGYKGGTFNPQSAAGAQQPADPENVQAYEIGYKGKIGRAISASFAAYHYKYSDLQVTVINSVNNVLLTSLQNAPKARINGIEANLDARLSSEFSVNAGMSLIDSKILKFPNASVSVPGFFVNGLPAGNVTVSRDVAGKHLLRAPSHTFNVGANYSREMEQGTLSLNAAAVFSAKYYVDVLNRISAPAYENVNASITWTMRNGVSVSAFVQNLTDEKIVAAIFESALNDQVSYQKPRWGGVTLGYKF